MIEQAVTLYTDLFETTTPKSNFINERCFGEDFALWLKDHLLATDLQPSEPIQEDWGWVLLVPYADKTFTLAIGVMDDSIGKSPAEWRVGVAFEKPLNKFGTWFRRPPYAELSSLAQKVQEILRSEPRIQKITSE
jgi:hypothetical protein